MCVHDIYSYMIYMNICCWLCRNEMTSLMSMCIYMFVMYNMVEKCAPTNYTTERVHMEAKPDTDDEKPTK